MFYIEKLNEMVENLLTKTLMESTTSKSKFDDALEAVVVFLPLEKSCKHCPEGKD